MTQLPSGIVFYVAGPMTGIAEHNYPAFERAANILRRAGYEVASPHEVTPLTTAEHAKLTQPYGFYIKRDIFHMIDRGCGALVLLPGWPASKGATLELQIAQVLEWPIYFLVEGVETHVPSHLLSMQTGEIVTLWTKQHIPQHENAAGQKYCVPSPDASQR